MSDNNNLLGITEWVQISKILDSVGVPHGVPARPGDKFTIVERVRWCAALANRAVRKAEDATYAASEDLVAQVYRLTTQRDELLQKVEDLSIRYNHVADKLQALVEPTPEHEVTMKTTRVKLKKTINKRKP